MSWTDDQIERLHTRMADAKRQGVWLSTAEAWIVIGLIRCWRRATMRSTPATGIMPTIGDARAQGIKNVYVTCSKCQHTRKLTLDELRLPDATAFVDIPRRLRFRCTGCQRRQATVMADWPSRAPDGPTGRR